MRDQAGRTRRVGSPKSRTMPGTQKRRRGKKSPAAPSTPFKGLGLLVTAGAQNDRVLDFNVDFNGVYELLQVELAPVCVSLAL